MKKTLVLDSSFRPLAIIGWRRALELSFSDNIQVLDFYLDGKVHTITKAYPIPAVIRTKYAGRHKQSFIPTRSNIFLRDCYQCQYCGIYGSRHTLTLDHLIPKVLGGKNTWENLVTACIPCNQMKGGRLLHETHMKLLRNPFKPKSFFFSVNDPPEEWKPYL